MYNFVQKTQSIWFIAYASAILLALLTAFVAFNVVSFSGLTEANALLFSGLLFAIGAGFGFGALESGERKLFWRWGLVWLLSILVGLVFTLGSVVTSLMNKQLLFNINVTDLYVIGLPFLVYGTILFFVGMSEETRDSFGKLTIIYLLLALLGFILGLIGAGLFVSTIGGKNPISGVPSWEVFMELAIVLGTLGIIPIGFVMGSRESLKEKFHKGWILWAVLSLVGVIMLILSLFEILTNIDTVAIGGASYRQAGLVLALVFEAPGFIFLMASTDKTDLVKKLSFVWILGIIVGLGLTFANQFASSLPNSTVGSGLSLIILFSGLLYKAISLDYTPSAGQSVSRPSRAVSSGVAVSSSSAGGFEVPSDLIPEEQNVYIEMQRKVNENTIIQLNNYAKSNKLAKSFVDRKVAELKATNDKAEDLIASIVEQAKRSSRQSFFKDTVATDSQPAQRAQPVQPSRPSSPSMNAPPMSPPGPPSSPPPPMGVPKAPSSSAPPMPPAPPMNAPPKAPSSSAPPMPPAPPSVSGPPKPPMPPGMPPAPPSVSGPPKPPGLPPMPSSSTPPIPGQPAAPGKPPSAPSGDAVGTARSTSIAELRGEMLKELRRLRDIFNEDQK